MKFTFKKAKHIAKPFVLAAVVSIPLVSIASAQSQSRQDVMVVFDASGSMWGQVDGVAKIEIARDAFGDLLGGWKAGNTRAGLIAYGHRRKGDCTDIELLAQPSEGADIASLVAGLQPRGKTPLSDAVRQAAETLKFTEEAATVVLLSDGVETCEADPCAVGADLEALGLDFTAHVIGFDIADADRAQLQCLADATGGQYFDAADASGLAEAMKGVVVATATPTVAPEPEESELALQPVTIRVKMDNGLLILPKEVVVFAGDQELGRLTDSEAIVPGLAIDLPMGPIALRVEGTGVSGETAMDITSETDIILLEVSAAADEYVIWREGQLPVASDHIVLIKNATGVDRSTFVRVYLYPLGSTDEAQQIKAHTMAPSAGVFHPVTIPSPPTPGDYDIVVAANDGSEYARIPVSFAASITQVWLGAREVAAGGTLDAYWAGSSNRSDGFQFSKDDKRVSRVAVSSMAQDDGFKLTAPDAPGVYDLTFLSRDADNNKLETSLGQIAVGVPMPSNDDVEPKPLDLDDTDFVAEVDAMGGEEFPTLPIGDLHGNWQLIFQNDARTILLIKSQLSHAEGEEMGGGGLVVEAHPDWGLGPTGSYGEMILAHDGDNLLMTLTVTGGTLVTTLLPTDLGWAGAIKTTTGETHNVVLVRPENLDAVEGARDANPIEHQFRPVDERGTSVETAIDWTFQNVATGMQETFQSQGSRTELFNHAPGNYILTATSGDLYGKTNIQLGRGLIRSNAVVMKPKDEGADLALDVTFYCSPDEDCDMKLRILPIAFTLPVGWGAEEPFAQFTGAIQFNMTTNTADGPFYATLNQPQRMADLGPCFDLMQGTFCHDTTDDPKLLADIEILKRTLSFQVAGRTLIGDDFDDLLQELTGAAE